MTPLKSETAENESHYEQEIGLASDDATNLSNTWQWGKLVLNKACWEKSLSMDEALYSFVERSERF